MTATETLQFVADAAKAAEWYVAQGRLNDVGCTLDAISCVASGTSHISRRVGLDAMIDDWKRETAVEVLA